VSLTGLRVYMVGIGGSGMCGLAAMLLRNGAIVSGSDRAECSATLRLGEAGANVNIGQRPGNLPEKLDVVVASAAIKESNPELIEARRRGLEVVKYAAMLGRIMRQYKGIAIAGTHGKSTTTALTAYILKHAGLDPSFVVGATAGQLGGGSGAGGGEHFIAEACEYDHSFLNLAPRYAAILNIEEDHLDCYADLDEIIEAFAAFCSLVPADGLIVANNEDRAVAAATATVRASVERFGFDSKADWWADNLEVDHGRFTFDLMHGNGSLGRMRLRLAGRHNVANALAASAIACHCGVQPEALAEALAGFEGTHRRMTVRGQVNGATVVDDYAHHPTAVQVTLKAIRQVFEPKRMWVVFQPHQHSRTRMLLNDFARSFGQADTVIIPDIYFVRDSEQERSLIGSRDLVERIRANGGEALYLPELSEAAEYVRKGVAPGDVVVTMGAGDVWKVADELVQRS
jgi:UDP-N-acetylmuramate--alanine ligase